MYGSSWRRVPGAFAVGLEQCVGHVEADVGVAVRDLQHAGVVVGDVVHRHAVDPRHRALPVVRVPLQRDRLARDLGLEHERSGADRVLGEVLAQLLVDRLRDDPAHRVPDGLREHRLHVLQVDAHRRRVERLHRVDRAEERVLAVDLRVGEALERELDVVRRHLVAGGELGVAEVEDVLEAALVDVPVLGEARAVGERAGDDVGQLVVDPQQRAEVAVVTGGRQLRVHLRDRLEDPRPGEVAAARRLAHRREPDRLGHLLAVPQRRAARARRGRTGVGAGAQRQCAAATDCRERSRRHAEGRGALQELAAAGARRVGGGVVIGPSRVIGPSLTVLASRRVRATVLGHGATPR